MARIDLPELARRENEQTEWKENVADPEDVVKALVAFANDLPNLGGGYVVCGAREEKDAAGFQVLVRTGLASARLKEIEGRVLDWCRTRVFPPIAPLTDELPSDAPERRTLVFTQPATGQAHQFRGTDAATRHFVRVGRSTVEARNGLLRELFVRKGALPPWDRRPCGSATVADLDLLALRDALTRMGAFAADIGLEPYLSAERPLSPFVPTLCVRDPLDGTLRPRNYAVLLFGRDVQRFVPGAVSLFSLYPGHDRSDAHAERHELAGTLLDQSRSLAALLDAQAVTLFDKRDVASPNAVKYPRCALYEAMGNALAHRDYESDQPTRLTAFADRIEVRSPGALPLGVGRQDFRAGKAGAHWRNQALVWFFSRLQLAQAEGQGISTILRTMSEEGCPPPTLDATATEVRCILPAHPRHALLRPQRG
jgi:ATP-dependent DNA helicase RecG